MRHLRSLLIAAALMAPAGAPAQESLDYLDDRSSAARVILSLYNAINRHEYARAWSYWGEGVLSDYEGFVAGFAATERVDVMLGEESVEGAAGSTYHSLAVAIAAYNIDGSVRIFAGCFLLRLVSPTIQEPPFRGLHIERGSLRASKLPLGEALPASCGE
ncbi:MAG: hypothetical protein WEB63_09455 [Cucumibacter sp.]